VAEVLGRHLEVEAFGQLSVFEDSFFSLADVAFLIGDAYQCVEDKNQAVVLAFLFEANSKVHVSETDLK